MTPDELVQREVICCVSMLIQHFASNPESSGYSYEEDILPLCERENWQSAAEAEGWDYDLDINHDTGMPVLTFSNASLGEFCTFDSWQELCEEQGIEPDQDEVYEHWIVTEWLAEKLAAKGEVTGELFGLTLWGRCTTGQMLSMDRVIKEVADEL